MQTHCTGSCPLPPLAPSFLRNLRTRPRQRRLSLGVKAAPRAACDFPAPKYLNRKASPAFVHPCAVQSVHRRIPGGPFSGWRGPPAKAITTPLQASFRPRILAAYGRERAPASEGAKLVFGSKFLQRCICGFLDAKDVLSFALICRATAEVTSDEDIWGVLLRRSFPKALLMNPDELQQQQQQIEQKKVARQREREPSTGRQRGLAVSVLSVAALSDALSFLPELKQNPSRWDLLVIGGDAPEFSKWGAFNPYMRPQEGTEEWQLLMDTLPVGDLLDLAERRISAIRLADPLEAHKVAVKTLFAIVYSIQGDACCSRRVSIILKALQRQQLLIDRETRKNVRLKNLPFQSFPPHQPTEHSLRGRGPRSGRRLPPAMEGAPRNGGDSSTFGRMRRGALGVGATTRHSRGLSPERLTAPRRAEGDLEGSERREDNGGELSRRPYVSLQGRQRIVAALFEAKGFTKPPPPPKNKFP
ncbi:hypothetical protein cyc_02144 [Cyclospora cayetanensis]|uniref:F-box domain-containing protein n=1 Tax=Cyclospora cayetanensis TaxID=88456 RepID=A0A1D3CTV9_9EIME|nr:hypothetical protein cyc_02144 [Cyclospora cayetanensis]